MVRGQAGWYSGNTVDLLCSNLSGDIGYPSRFYVSFLSPSKQMQP
jgi:hypothetical protein